jgi:hypothetical protein
MEIPAVFLGERIIDMDGLAAADVQVPVRLRGKAGTDGSAWIIFQVLIKDGF